MADAAGSRVARVLAARAGRESAASGDALDVVPDRLLMDAEGGLVLADAFNRLAKRVREGLGERVIMVDGGRMGRRDRPNLLAFAEELKAAVALDPALAGWPSQVAMEEGLVGSDDVICALDPEAGALGGLGAVVLATAPDVAASLLRRRTLPVTVPQTVRVGVEGRLPRWLGPYDLALAILEAVGGRDEVRGFMLELSGDTLTAMPVDDRMSLCGVLARAGVSALVPPDAATRTWMAARSAAGVARDDEPLPEGPPDVVVNARELQPSALSEPWPGRPLDPAGDEVHTIQQVILGGRLSELRQASHALSERPLHPGLHLVVLPASRRVLLQAMEEGLITAFVRSGASILPPGSPPPSAPKRDRRVTTVPTGASDLFTGAAVAGASALAGRLVDPETVRREQRRSAAIR